MKKLSIIVLLALLASPSFAQEKLPRTYPAYDNVHLEKIMRSPMHFARYSLMAGCGQPGSYLDYSAPPLLKPVSESFPPYVDMSAQSPLGGGLYKIRTYRFPDNMPLLKKPANHLVF